MSRITKVICDECEKEIELNEWFYSTNIINQSTNSDIGKQVVDGDYCKKCFTEIIKEELGI